jgi:hypothetical protein
LATSRFRSQSGFRGARLVISCNKSTVINKFQIVHIQNMNCWKELINTSQIWKSVQKFDVCRMAMWSTQLCYQGLPAWKWPQWKILTHIFNSAKVTIKCNFMQDTSFSSMWYSVSDSSQYSSLAQFTGLRKLLVLWSFLLDFY